MFDDRRRARVGAITTVIVGAAVLFLVFVDLGALRPSVTLQVFFAHAGPLEAGVDVQIAGRQVGKIVDIGFVPGGDLDADHPLFPDGGVVALTRIDADIRDRVRTNSEFFVNTKGILGNAYLEIGPPPADEPLGPLVSDGSRVRGVDPARMEEIIVTGFENMQKARELFAAVAPDARALRDSLVDLDRTLREIEPAPGDYDALRGSARRLGGELERLEELAGEVDATTIDGLVARAETVTEALVAALDELGDDYERARGRMARLGERIPEDTVRKLSEAATRARIAAARVERIADRLRELSSLIEHGQGTVGALLNDPAFSDEAKALGKHIKSQPWLLIGRPIR